MENNRIQFPEHSCSCANLYVAMRLKTTSSALAIPETEQAKQSEEEETPRTFSKQTYKQYSRDDLHKNKGYVNGKFIKMSRGEDELEREGRQSK